MGKDEYISFMNILDTSVLVFRMIDMITTIFTSESKTLVKQWELLNCFGML